MTVKIKNLIPGESAVIAGYEQGNSYYRQKLLSMGLIKGTVITLLKTAPFGDPVQIELRGFRLSLRKTEADVLILENVGASADQGKGFMHRLRRRMGFYQADRDFARSRDEDQRYNTGTVEGSKENADTPVSFGSFGCESLSGNPGPEDIRGKNNISGCCGKKRARGSERAGDSGVNSCCMEKGLTINIRK